MQCFEDVSLLKMPVLHYVNHIAMQRVEPRKRQ